MIELIVRMLYMFVSVLTQARNRHRLERLINAYRRLARKRPKVVQLWSWGIIFRCISITFSDLIHYTIIAFYAWRSNFTAVVFFIIIYLPVSFLDMISFQFYFALLNAHAYYRLLNQELRSLIAEIITLESLVPRQAAFMIQCSSLADRLDAIALEQTQLQQLIDNLTEMFGLQSLFMSAHYYITMVTLPFYSFYVLSGNESMELKLVKLGLFISQFIGYLLGMYSTSKMAFGVLDEHAETVRLLTGCSTFGLRLDKRLESVVSRFLYIPSCTGSFFLIFSS